MKKFKDLLEKRWFAYTFAICAGILFFFIIGNLNYLGVFLGFLWKLLTPIIIGLVLAYLLNPIVNFFENKPLKGVKLYSVRHALAVIITLLCFAGALGLFVYLVIVPVVTSAPQAISSLISYRPAIEEFINELLEKVPFIDTSGFEATVNNYINSFIASIPENIDLIISKSIDIGSGIFSAVIGFILCIYFLLGKRMLVNGINRLRRAALLENTYKKHNEFFLRCHNILIRYIFCDLLDALIVGGINAAMMAVFGMKFIPLVTLIVAVTNLFPTFGPIVGAVLGAAILFFSDPWHPLIFIIATLVIQTVDGYILKPKLFGNLLGVPAVWILIMIIVGSGLFGIAGVFLSIPVAAILKFLYDEAFLPFLKKKRVQREEKKKQMESQESS